MLRQEFEKWQADTAITPHLDDCSHPELPVDVCGCWQIAIFAAGKTLATIQNNRVITLDPESVKAVARQLLDTEICCD